MNRGEEDYIKHLYELQELNPEEAFIANQVLADAMGHTPQTVNEMIKRLMRKKMVTYQRYKGTRLTESGKAIAIDLIRKHRLWELFLVKHLNFSWEDVHSEAEKLEHVTSKALEDSLYHYLGEPTRCPHGNVIPSLDGKISKLDHKLLKHVSPNERLRISRVLDDPKLLIYLDELGLKLGDEVTVTGVDAMSGIIHLQKGDRALAIGGDIPNQIFIETILGGNTI